MKTSLVNGIPEVSPDEVFANLNQVKLVDVRRPEEFNGELAHIKGAELKTLGPELIQYLEQNSRDKAIVFVCKSGGRSAQATLVSLQMGYKSTYNMSGGMMEWNARQLPTERNS